MRCVWVMAVLLSVLGCQKNQMSFDPFSTSGPTQMPPPGTGSAGRPDPYYRPSSSAATSGATRDGPQATMPAGMARFTSDQEGPATELADRSTTGFAPAAR